MTPQQKEHLDTSLLRVMAANHSRFGLQAAALQALVRPLGTLADEMVIVDRVEYLVGKGFVAEANKEIGKAVRAWRITDAGREWLDEQGY